MESCNNNKFKIIFKIILKIFKLHVMFKKMITKYKKKNKIIFEQNLKVIINIFK